MIVATVAPFFDPIGVSLRKQLRGRLKVRAAFAGRPDKSTKALNQPVDRQVKVMLDDWLKTVTNIGV